MSLHARNYAWNHSRYVGKCFALQSNMTCVFMYTSGSDVKWTLCISWGVNRRGTLFLGRMRFLRIPVCSRTRDWRFFAFDCSVPPLPQSTLTRVFLRRFRNRIWVPRISNRVPRIRENYHRVPKIIKNRVPRIREIGSLQIQTGS